MLRISVLHTGPGPGMLFPPGAIRGRQAGAILAAMATVITNR
jgi:hypothetical protein